MSALVIDIFHLFISFLQQVVVRLEAQRDLPQSPTDPVRIARPGSPEAASQTSDLVEERDTSPGSSQATTVTLTPSTTSAGTAVTRHSFARTPTRTVFRDTSEPFNLPGPVCGHYCHSISTPRVRNCRWCNSTPASPQLALRQGTVAPTHNPFPELD